MKKDDVDYLFERNQSDFDLFEPEKDHKARFLVKLEKQVEDANHDEKPVIQLPVKSYNWSRILSIAASVAIIFGIFSTIMLQQQETEVDLASISPQLEETQDFFTIAISSQLEQINALNSIETKKIVSDALEQIDNLEKDYAALKTDLIDSGYDKRVISAMIKNFQQRTALLEQTLEEMNSIKELKFSQNENNII